MSHASTLNSEGEDVTIGRAREEAEEREAQERKQAVAAAREVFKKELAEQIAERQAAREGKKVKLACEETAMEATHQV